MTKHKLIVGNWKMHGIIPEASIMIEKLKKELGEVKKTEVVICPPFVDLMSADESVKGTNLKLGAQNIFWEEEGAFTGEISPLMLKGLCKYVIVGHSERRIYLGETDKMVAKKAAACVRHELTPILCVGDSLQDFAEGFSKVTILSQLQAGVNLLTSDEVKKIVIAYEPIWVVGTGQIVNSEEVEYLAKIILQRMVDLFPLPIVRNNIRIVYGGNIDSNTIKSFINLENIDGFLIGATSLKVEELLKIGKLIS